MSKQTHSPDCTNKCHSTHHGDAITAAITKRSVTDSDLCAYLTYMCCCCETVKDIEGRTALHIAASCGRTGLVKWLIENRHANINIKDKESGYTALHRSMFYGKIDTVVELIKIGSNIGVQDANGLTYLEHAMIDRFHPEFPIDSGELFTWGTNSNNSLGSQQPRTVPETMDIFHKEYPNENVKMVFINEFHSIIQTDTGAVYSCGHGHGGRLGLGVQHTEVIPKQIKFQPPSNITHTSDRIQVTSCSIARDHSLFLTSLGILYSCGLNKHRVLGIAPPPVELLVPKSLKHFTDNLLSVATGNCHSVVWSDTDLFTWGLNAGQLGHPLSNALDDKYILTPKRVKYINSKENKIKFVCASTGATVVYTEKGDIYVLHEYQCRKIASRQLNLIQLSVIGGKLNYTLDPDLSNKNRTLIVAALTNTGNIMVWQETDPILRRCIFSINRALNIKQISINISHILFVTNDGEAFKGEIKPRKKKTVIVEKDKNTKSDFHKFLEKDECILVKLERIARIHRALNIQSDPKGLNFGIVQVRPYNFFDFYDICESTMFENMDELLAEADSSDDITDLVINVGSRKFLTHKYILASRSQYFAKLFENNNKNTLDLKGYNPDIFEQLLQYIYTRNTELINTGELKSDSLRTLCIKVHESKEQDIDDNKIIDENKSAFECYSKSKQHVDKDKNNVSKLDNPVRMLHEMAKRFEISDLQKILSNLDMFKYTVRIKKDGKSTKVPPIIFDRGAFQELCDVEITVKDNRIIKAHKCILSARLDYFNSMFSSRWKGGETSKISMSFTKGVVEALLEFLYTDSLNKLEEREVDQLFQIIILADQFFVTRLKDQCEHILSQLISIKNATQLLTFADAYNAETLKEICFDFIQQNMTSFLEMRLLDELDPGLLKELSEFYQIRRRVDYRVITPYSTAVSDDEISQISSSYPVDIAVRKEKPSKEKQKLSSRKRVRSHKNSLSERNLSQSLEKESVLLSSSLPSEIPELDSSFSKGQSTRFKAILIANDIGISEEIEESFVALSKKTNAEEISSSFVDAFDFPLLNSPPKPSGFHSKTPYKLESKHKPVKLSQKQRKRLSSESSNQVNGSPPLEVSVSPKNPWKIIPDPISPVNIPGNDNIENIISSELKQKENLVKITSKQLVFTQLEDKAIDELKRFYSVDDVEDEMILIERVSVGAVALPVWVPKTK